MAVACGAAQSPEGRWEGLLQIPGREQPLVVDLAQAGSGGWTGSIILSGLGIKGAPHQWESESIPGFGAPVDIRWYLKRNHELGCASSCSNQRKLQ